MAKAAKVWQGNTPTPKQRTRMSPSKAGYDKRWVEFRKRYLTLNPYCVDCQAHGQRTFAKHVHHVHKLSECPEDKYNVALLMPLCPSCHQVRTNGGE